MRTDRRADARAADRLLERASQVAILLVRDGDLAGAEAHLLCAGVSAMMLLGEVVTT